MALCKYCALPEHSGGCDREQLKRAIDTLREDLRIRTMELQATRKLDGDNVIMITSLISHKTQKPRIDIQVGQIHAQVPVDAALHIARNLIEISAGSYADGFLFNFIQDKLGLPIENSGEIVREFREYRDALAIEFKKDQEEG